MEQGDSSFFKTHTIAIVGLGLIGGSYAKGLRRLGASRIIAVDINDDALAKAKAEGVIDEGYTTGGEVLGEADLVIFCMAAEAMISFIRDNVNSFKKDVILTDVAGIKGNTADRLHAILPDTIDFVAGHPMAGREGSGYGMSQAEIFDGANYIIVPDPSNTPEHIALVREMAVQLGCSHVVTVTPGEHDQLIAYTSTLPHVLATALVNSQSMNPMTKFFVAGSFRDGTRVADINAPLWTQLFLSNKDNLIAEIDKYAASLQTVRQLVATEDADGLNRFLKQAAMRRRELIHEKHSR